MLNNNHSLDQNKNEGFLLNASLPRHIFVLVPPKPGPGFPMSYVMVFFLCLVNSIKMSGDSSFFIIGGIDDHHCLIFLFIMYKYTHFEIYLEICFGLVYVPL